jgi:calmodulin
MASAAARERYARKNEAADLKRAFNVLDSKGDGKIDPEELNQVFQALGHKPRRGEVQDLIWEVDEDCDGCIGWQEFQRMYHRCRQDSTGEAARVCAEPARTAAAVADVPACQLLLHGSVMLPWQP